MQFVSSYYKYNNIYNVKDLIPYIYYSESIKLETEFDLIDY